MNVLPVFCSHYGIGESLLTLDEPGKSKPGNPVSVFDLSQSAGLKEVTIIDSRIDGFIQAHKVADKLDVKFCFGLKFIVCASSEDKTPESRRTESKIIIMIRNTEGYSDLLRLHNEACGKSGNFRCRIKGDTLSYGRLDWVTLNRLWTPNLVLVLPYFSSFLNRNLLTFNQITPNLPVKPWVLREIESSLPFAPLIDAAIDRYVGVETDRVVPVKTIYYADAAAFKSYVTFRAISNGGTWDEPNVDHLHSNAFSMADWRRLTL